jgi:tetratricopeptide (TPR) repeat protein
VGMSEITSSETLDTADIESTFDPAGSALETRHLPLRRGSMISRYVLLSPIGHGGMGVVWKAHDPDLDRNVAIKFVLPGWGEQGRMRMQREARALGKLSHPNVVVVYDFGVLDERIWVAMALIQGVTISEWLDAAERHPVEIIEMFVQAGRGLAAAHAEGVTHRDFKPANVMVGDDGLVRVMDFGLARTGSELPVSGELGHDNDDSEPLAAPLADTEGGFRVDSGNELTEAGAVLGTLPYMAPEQARGELSDARSDQFSFCTSLYEALYDVRLFGGRTLERYYEVADCNPLPGSSPSGLTSEIRSVLARGLRLDPDQRYPDMESLLIAISRALEPSKRSRYTWFAFGVAASGFIGCLVVAGEGYRRFELGQRIAACKAEGATIGEVWNDEAGRLVRRAIVGSDTSYAADTADKVMPWLDEYARTWQAARTTACLNSSVNEEEWDADMLDRSLWCLDERRMELEALVAQLERGDSLIVSRAVRAAAGLGRVDPCMDEDLLARLPAPPVDGREQIQAVRAQLSRASALRQLGDFKGSLSLARESLERAKALDWPPLSALARYRVGALLTDTGEFEESTALLKDAYFEAANAGVPEVESDAATALVFTLGVRLARHAEGREWFRHAELTLSALPNPLQLREALLLGHLASVEFGAGSHERAMELQQRSLALREQALGSSHPDVWGSLGNLALIHEKLGEYEQARSLHERALVLIEDELGPQHPDMGSILNNLSENYRMTGEYAEAKQLSERGLSIKELALGPEHPSVANSLGNLALVLEGMGSYAEAQPMLERVVAIKQAALGPEHPDVASTLNNLAENHRSLGEYQEALALHQRALAIKESALGPNHTSVGLSLTNLAIVYQALGEYEQAKTHFERALVIFERDLGDAHVHLSYPLLGLAEIALEQQRAADALPLAERGLALRDQPGQRPADVANARFIVAQALWETGGSRSRAHDLAMQARASFQSVDVAKVDAWLASHELNSDTSP